MEFSVLLVACTSLSTVYFAWKYSSALKVITKHNSELLESHTQLRFKLDSAVHSLDIKEKEVKTTVNKLSESNSLIRALEAEKKALKANYLESVEREKQLRDEAATREKQLRGEIATREKQLIDEAATKGKQLRDDYAALQESARKVKLCLAEVAAELQESEMANQQKQLKIQQLQAALDQAQKAGSDDSGLVRCHGTTRGGPEEEKEQGREGCADGEKQWKAENAALKHTLNSYEALLDEMAEQSRKSERTNEDNKQRIQELQMALREALRAGDGEVTALKGQLAAVSTKVNQLHQELAGKDSTIASLKQSINDLRNNALKKEKQQTQCAALQTQCDQLKAQTDKERSMLQQEIAILKRQFEETAQVADQWKKRCEAETKQCSDLQSAVDARKRQVAALELQLQSTPQGSAENRLCVECVVCLDRPKCILFEPCRHICVCEPCSKRLRRCPLCTRDIRKRKFGYLSI